MKEAEVKSCTIQNYEVGIQKVCPYRLYWIELNADDFFAIPTIRSSPPSRLMNFHSLSMTLPVPNRTSSE